MTRWIAVFFASLLLSAPVSLAAGPALGARTVEIDSALRTHLGGPADSGVLVQSVDEGSLAAPVLKVGDVVFEVAGEAVLTSDGLDALIGEHAGERIQLGVIRNGKEKKLHLEVPATTMQKLVERDSKEWTAEDWEAWALDLEEALLATETELVIEDPLPVWSNDDVDALFERIAGLEERLDRLSGQMEALHEEATRDYLAPRAPER